MWGSSRIVRGREESGRGEPRENEERKEAGKEKRMYGS
jgi:hypothetical protein